MSNILPINNSDGKNEADFIFKRNERNYFVICGVLFRDSKILMNIKKYTIFFLKKLNFVIIR